MRHYLTGDLHGGHGNIMKYCHRVAWLNDKERKMLEKIDQWKLENPAMRLPEDIDFRPSQESIERMDSALIFNINQIVQPDDVLWMLGDFCFNSNYAKKIRDRIHCKTIHFFWGNHDKRVPEVKALFVTDNDLAAVSIASDGKYWIHEHKRGNTNMVLSHYCMAIWENSHHGAYHFYGHSHGSAESMMDEKFPFRHSMDVGVDNAFKVLGEYRPFSLDELKKIMDSKPEFQFIDHHK